MCEDKDVHDTIITKGMETGDKECTFIIGEEMPWFTMTDGTCSCCIEFAMGKQSFIDLSGNMEVVRCEFPVSDRLMMESAA